VIISASTSGPSAIGELVAQLPADFTAPCFIVQHLPASFTAPFAAQLKRRAKVPVRVAEEGDRVEAGLVLVAPGAMHLLITPDGRVHLQTPASKDFYRTSIDIAMASAAEADGAAAIGVVLNGSGNDGSKA
jgi:two-component system chemotaxis response regulator CheB